MTTSNDVMTIARYFIQRNRADRKGLTNKKLQKLLYYSQAWSLALHNKKMFSANIEAWIHGPAIPSVYLAYKNYGSNEITEEFNPDILQNIDRQDLEILDSVWEVYGKYDGDYLELLSHSEKPWQNARKDTPDHISSNSIISTRVMKMFYGEKLKEAQS